MGGRGKGTTVHSVLSFDGLSDADAQNRLAQLQAQMGQTGDEAGQVNPGSNKRKLYVNTSKSFNINQYLRTDGKQIDHPNSDWTWMMGYNARMIKNDIQRIDSGMRPLSQDMQLYRWNKYRSAR